MFEELNKDQRYEALIETGLFSKDNHLLIHLFNHEMVRLYFALEPDFGIICAKTLPNKGHFYFQKKISDGWTDISFEELFSLAGDELKEKMLFHLSLLKECKGFFLDSI